MKRITFLLLLAGLLSVGFRTTTAQTTQNAYLVVEYMKVKPGMGDQYLETENAWKKLHQERKNSGEITAWALYQVRFPAGTGRSYDYVTVTTYSSLDRVEAPFSDDMINRLNTEPIYSNTENTRDLINGELWVQTDRTEPTTPTRPPSRLLQVDHMNVAPGKGDAYVKMERELAKPIHMERIKAGKLSSWSLYSRILPAGTNLGYNYTTANGFEKLSQMEDSYSEELIRRALPDKDLNVIFTEFDNSRDLVQSHLWQLVDYTE